MTLVRNRFFQAYGFWHWGEGIQTVLFTWYMTFHANLSATEIGLFQALVLSPFLIFAVIGGVLTDRFGASLSYITSTTLFGIILVSYGLLDSQFGYIPALFVLYCLLAGIVSAISNPAIDTFIPDATKLPVQDNSLLAANAHNIAKLTGNVSGLALPLLAATGGFILNGILMFISVVLLAAHTRKNPKRKTDTKSSNVIRDRMQHRIVSHYRSCPENFDILLSSALLGLLIVPAGYILMPLVLRERFPEYGDLIAFLGISSWIGAITVTGFARAKSAQILKPGSVSLMIWSAYGLGLLLLMAVGNFWMLCALVTVFGGVKVGKAMVYGNYLHNCPKAERGMFVAIDQTDFWGTATLGTMGLGALVDRTGLDATIMLTSSCIVLGALFLAIRGHLTSMRQV